MAPQIKKKGEERKFRVDLTGVPDDKLHTVEARVKEHLNLPQCKNIKLKGGGKKVINLAGEKAAISKEIAVELKKKIESDGGKVREERTRKVILKIKKMNIEVKTRYEDLSKDLSEENKIKGIQVLRLERVRDFGIGYRCADAYSATSAETARLVIRTGKLKHRGVEYEVEISALPRFCTKCLTSGHSARFCEKAETCRGCLKGKHVQEDGMRCKVDRMPMVPAIIDQTKKIPILPCLDCRNRIIDLYERGNFEGAKEIAYGKRHQSGAETCPVREALREQIMRSLIKTL